MKVPVRKGAITPKKRATSIVGTTNTNTATISGGGNGGRPLQRKTYDALVDPTLPPDEVRRLRRILSNRESARRSRKRKASQVSTLEDELAEARVTISELEVDLNSAVQTAQALDVERTALRQEVASLRRRLQGVLEAHDAPIDGTTAVETPKPIPTDPPAPFSQHQQCTEAEAQHPHPRRGRGPFLPSPLRQVGVFSGHLSHRVRFRPTPTPSQEQQQLFLTESTAC